MQDTFVSDLVADHAVLYQPGAVCPTIRARLSDDGTAMYEWTWATQITVTPMCVFHPEDRFCADPSHRTVWVDTSFIAGPPDPCEYAQLTARALAHVAQEEQGIDVEGLDPASRFAAEVPGVLASARVLAAAGLNDEKQTRALIEKDLKERAAVLGVRRPQVRYALKYAEGEVATWTYSKEE